MYTVYILRSVKDGGYYFGHCENLSIRLERHNAGKVKSTKSRIPFIIHYTETFAMKSEAFNREMFFKSFEGRKWLHRNNKI